MCIYICISVYVCVCISYLRSGRAFGRFSKLWLVVGFHLPVFFFLLVLQRSAFSMQWGRRCRQCRFHSLSSDWPPLLLPAETLEPTPPSAAQIRYGETHHQSHTHTHRVLVCNPPQLAGTAECFGNSAPYRPRVAAAALLSNLETIEINCCSLAPPAGLLP